MVARILIAAGGTGGHIIPALALARELRSRGHEVLMVGNRGGMEVGMFKKAGLPYRLIFVQKLYRRFTPAHVRFPFRLLGALLASRRIIKEYKPHAYIGTGSYVSGPVGLVARLLGVSVFLQEQNSFPGLANRWLSRFATKVYVGYESACKVLSARDCVLTGNPLLPAPDDDDLPPAPGLRPGAPVLFVIGGSQGSRALNESLEPVAAHIAGEGIDILWQTGAANLEHYSKRFENVEGVHIFGFIDDMPRFYHAATFAMARAGALTLAELETHRVPSLLVPLPTAAENHQYFNALELTTHGQAMMLEQKDLDPGHLYEMLLRLRNAAPSMKAHFSDSKHSSAAAVIIDDLLATIEQE
ncbi:MAG: undecaprenyldiphospho-muramoylpentapeptide beta-N-acetylglucosaminyltransferase [Candidatus Cloacimonetes bacterium]|nr:undecaprenyldiphospho-muramoylpentapeptide beta-N-acetylglucosaminyltransferase [Candidatus Cloacimonadota bacterium]